MSRVRYFHGGTQGLAVGDRILPPARTGAMTLTRIVRENPVLALRPDSARPDRVYIATDMQMSTSYAILQTLNPFSAGDGQAYEVRPDGEPEPDPHMREPGRAWVCSSATVTKLITPPLPRDVVIGLWPKARELELMFLAYKRAVDSGEQLTMNDHKLMVAFDRMHVGMYGSAERALTLVPRLLGLR